MTVWQRLKHLAGSACRRMAQIEAYGQEPLLADIGRQKLQVHHFTDGTPRLGLPWRGRTMLSRLKAGFIKPSLKIAILSQADPVRYCLLESLRISGK